MQILHAHRLKFEKKPMLRLHLTLTNGQIDMLTDLLKAFYLKKNSLVNLNCKLPNATFESPKHASTLAHLGFSGHHVSYYCRFEGPCTFLHLIY
jgi:hypothetical protein